MSLTCSLIYFFYVLAPLDPHPVAELDKVVNKLRIKYRTYYMEFDAHHVRVYVLYIKFYVHDDAHICISLFKIVFDKKKLFLFRVL